MTQQHSEHGHPSNFTDPRLLHSSAVTTRTHSVDSVVHHRERDLIVVHTEHGKTGQEEVKSAKWQPTRLRCHRKSNVIVEFTDLHTLLVLVLLIQQADQQGEHSSTVNVVGFMLQLYFVCFFKYDYREIESSTINKSYII